MDIFRRILRSHGGYFLANAFISNFIFMHCGFFVDCENPYNRKWESRLGIILGMELKVTKKIEKVEKGKLEIK